jgi:hypothetical protein
VINWRPITPHEPEGSGTVLLFCSRSGWVRTAASEYVVGQDPGAIEPGTNYWFTHFAYIDHLDCVPLHHPFYELVLMDAGGEGEHDMLARTIGPRGESYEHFCNDEEVRYYSGQSDSHLTWMCGANYRFLFKTKEERLLGEIALAGKRA